MKTLNQKEWVAVILAIFVVGFFFIFGGRLLSIFTSSSGNTNMTTTSGLISKDTVVGLGEVAVPGSTVIVHYTGKFIDGKVFDSSVSRGEPFQFVLGGGQVIKGWDEGIVGMRVGGRRTLTIPPSLGYGANDYGPIPGGSTLIFDIELLRVER